MEALPCVYGPRPWLVAADEPETAAYFREHGRAEVFQPGTVLPFGREDVIYFIEHGLIATVPTRDGSLTRIAGLFGAETTLGLVRVLRGGNVKCEVINKVGGPHPNVVDAISSGEIKLLINTPSGSDARGDGYILRTEAVKHGVTSVTALTGANAFVAALEAVHDHATEGSQMEVIALQDL